jgi:hypothetical protein
VSEKVPGHQIDVKIMNFNCIIYDITIFNLFYLIIINNLQIFHFINQHNQYVDKTHHYSYNKSYLSNCKKIFGPDHSLIVKDPITQSIRTYKTTDFHKYNNQSI